MSRALHASLLAIVMMFADGFACCAEEVTFRNQIPETGHSEIITKDKTVKLHYKLFRNGEVVDTYDQFCKESSIRHVTVLASPAEAASKLAVRYEAAGNSKAEHGDWSFEPVVGKVYTVERKGNDLTVSYNDGTIPNDAETSVVKLNCRGLGKPSNFRVFDGKTLKIGDTYNLKPDELKAWDTGGDEGQLETLSAKLKSIRFEGDIKCGVFEIEMKLIGTPGPFAKVVGSLKGEFCIGISNCWLVSGHLKGPMNLKAENTAENGSKEVVVGSGEFETNIGVRLGPKK